MIHDTQSCQFVSKPSLLYNHKTTAARFFTAGEQPLRPAAGYTRKREKKKKKKIIKGVDTGKTKCYSMIAVAREQQQTKINEDLMFLGN